MRLFILLITVISLFGCKQQGSKSLTTPLNDNDLLDSLKNAYKEHYKDVNDPRGFVPYIGTTEFCYDKERLKIHKLLFSDTKDERFSNDYRSHKKASDSLINTFSIKERLVFALVYPEEFSQTCGFYIDLNDIPYDYISTDLPRGPDGYYASDRQLTLLEKNKDSVAIYLKSCYKEKKNIPLELYRYIIELELYQSISMLIEHYNKKENTFITETFLAFMIRDNYLPFMNSKLFNEMKGKFYKEGDSSWDLDRVEKTPERLKELLFHIQNYYQWKLQE